LRTPGLPDILVLLVPTFPLLRTLWRDTRKGCNQTDSDLFLRSVFSGPWDHGSRLESMGSEIQESGDLCLAGGVGRPDHCGMKIVPRLPTICVQISRASGNCARSPSPDRCCELRLSLPIARCDNSNSPDRTTKLNSASAFLEIPSVRSRYLTVLMSYFKPSK
jgi:hypothetical protein